MTSGQIYFCAIFDRPFAGYGTWTGGNYAAKGTNGNDIGIGRIFDF